MKTVLISFKVLLMMTLVTGFLYPASVTLYAYFFAHGKAMGSFIRVNDKEIGSALIAQKFSDPKYFWNRPSAVDYNPSLSGASNLSLTSLQLKTIVEKRNQEALLAHPESGKVPQDLLFASGSGLDPHISPEAAFFQAKRIAYNRQIDVRIIESLIQRYIEEPQYGLLGKKRVNVLKMNLALDSLREK